MEPKTTQIGKYCVTYFNREELKILEDEIFKEEIYSINLKETKNEVNILDVGTHIGLSTLYFKSIFPNSTILCFEPNPNTFPLLEENILCNGLKNVKTFNIAIGKKTGKRKLYIDSSGYCAFSTASFRKNAWNKKQKSVGIDVPTEPLSRYIKGKVDLLKLDVEGAEMEVLKELDSKDCFEKIEKMLIEFHPQKGQNIKNLLSILKRNNYNTELYRDGDIVKDIGSDLILVVAQK